MTPVLEVAGVSKQFGGVRALIDVFLNVEANQAVGLIGPNGAGKTTLFDCITGVTHQDSGTVRFEGTVVDGRPVHQRARLGIGRTFQRLELFTGLSVRDHFLVAEHERKHTGGLLHDLLWRPPFAQAEYEAVDAMLEELGLEGVCDTPIEALSLGQGRLVELGRALLRQPTLLLLDEPSSGLDSRETVALADVLNTVRSSREISLLLVEHDLELVHAVASRAVVLDFGRVIAEGPLAEVLADSAVQTAYLGKPA